MEEAARREAREALEAREAREARERHERDRAELLRKRDKHEHSANASTQVKQKLQVRHYSTKNLRFLTGSPFSEPCDFEPCVE